MGSDKNNEFTYHPSAFSPFYLLPWDDMAREHFPDAGTLILDFLAFRTVRNKFLFFVNYLVCDVYYIDIKHTKTRTKLLTVTISKALKSSRDKAEI
jgi:hypothetical protein